jgi:hypothetical protein
VQAELASLAKLAPDRAAARNLAAEAEESFRTQLKARIGDTPPVRVIFYQTPRPD